MRRFQQRQILQMIQTIHEAQKAGLYADCQDGAAALMQFIDSIKGRISEINELLELYYVLLFQVHSGEADKLILENHVKKMEEYVRTRMKPDKFEVVFLSYKSSMSDSIESIYQAAKSDPCCDAYWIPIPYFDRNKDGTLGNMHLEGQECYGDHILCTDWRQYNIETRRPDVIVTFNPYDEANYVTSVHPLFYCERLRKWTELLVYVPYLIHYERVSPAAAQLPGVVFSHLTIVQSDYVRDQYINSLNTLYNTGKQQIGEEKIVALGSPKIDKVLNLNKNDWILPSGWQHFFRGENSYKITVLYNTSIESALTYSCGENSLYLNKLKNVFDFFRFCTSAVLWWRPHPLLEQTFRSMRPQLYQQYADLVKNYKAEGIGIYDDSSDLHRAIAYADMCYGDDSSLDLLFQVAGKPTLIQNPRNHWTVSEIPYSAEVVKKKMDCFVRRDHDNSYIMIEEDENTTEERFALSAFIKHFDVIMDYSAEQSEKYRSRYRNADGTSGKAIYRYLKFILEGQS